MKANTRPLSDLFRGEVKYVVPLYQRPYVWREEKHWEPLWADLQSVIDQRLEDAVPWKEIAPHFLGAVVLQQQQTPAGSAQERHIIDGQQRLTTLQLLLAAGADVARAGGQHPQASRLRALIFNRDGAAVDADQIFKVRPSELDKDVYDVVLSSVARPEEVTGPPEAGQSYSFVGECYAFFRRRITDWLGDDQQLDTTQELKLDALVGALESGIHLVVIDLEDRDNAQVIFETLNARGTPLLAIDLVKNFLFLRAHDADPELVDYLYNQHWKDFDKPYWREEVRQGRLRRPRSELFLMHWLSMKRLKNVASHQLYSSFRELQAEVPDDQVGDLVKEVAQDGRIYASFDSMAPGSPEQRFFERLRVGDTSGVLPLALFLFRQRPSVLSNQDRALALSALESWLIRRAICGLTIKAYNRVLVELLRAVVVDPSDAHSIIVRTLRSARADINVWPDDAALDQALLKQPIYGRVTQPRIKMILTAVENELRKGRSEEMFIAPSGLSIEHLMPQAWEAHWPLWDQDPEARLEREIALQSIGNLTLVTKKLNSSVSNSSWEIKRDALADHSVLLINRQLLERDAEGWGETAIKRRSAWLSDMMKTIWPGPDADWSAEARTGQVLAMPAPPEMASDAPTPDVLVSQFARTAVRQDIMDQLIDELSTWDEVRIKVSGHARDKDRWIVAYRGRRTFCRLFPGTSELQIATASDNIVGMSYARELPGRGAYRVTLELRNQAAYREGLKLCMMAGDDAVTDEDEDEG